ncbi:MAG: NAD(P)/FAD-dependent oxidoreductase [Brasilonema angustatum HA4187-MV1]|jgi:monoamine oxidase|nr:NAD(P)/FAD-dependent oxidoreductase [Brasilonema angustatum HA4187-MV1]
MNRRDFITTVAVSGGSAYAAMKALGLLEKPATAQSPSQRGSFRLQSNGRGKRVIILGAGLAGMACAYELGKVGYDCIILEARSRAGGRCWTLRGGDQFTDTLGQTQTVQFDSGLYFNPGPARIPQEHVTLDYCREFGVAVEVKENLNRREYYYNTQNAGSLSGKKVRAREAITDIRGYISELLAKAVNQNAINAPLTTQDKEKLVEFLRTYGDLSPDLFYKGSSRRGFTNYPSAGLQPGTQLDPYDLSALIQLGFANYEAEEWDWQQQMTMLQPVGGIDQIAKAFERKVGNRITYQSQVKEIRKTPNGVSIVYTNSSGTNQQIKGDYCICTIPLPVLKGIPSDFSPDLKQAIDNVATLYARAGKGGLQFRRRFWEEDEKIFGGITWTDQDIVQIWYPSEGYLSNKGIMIGYYQFDDTKVGPLSPSQRLSLALEQGNNIHPQYRNEFENGVTLYWPTIPYNLGAWAEYTDEARQRYYPRLNEPDGNIYLCGEHLSYLQGWMAGALESARLVSSKINTLA